MSGTPILNRPSEIYIILKSFAPKALGKYAAWPWFVRRYCGYQGKGATHIEELEKVLSAFLLRRTKERVLDQLPEIVESIVHVPGINDDDSLPLPTRRRLVSLAKLDYIKEYVTDLLETIDKLVLVVYHKETIQKLSEVFKNSVTIHGGMDSNFKQRQINRFIEDPTCNLIIGQISVIGYGIDGLQNVCNYIVFGELDWSPGIIEQAKDRLRRIGQNNTVFAYYLIAAGTIEEDIDLKLGWKRKVIKELVKPSDIAVEKRNEEMTFEKQIDILLETLADRITVRLSSHLDSFAEKLAAKIIKQQIVLQPEVVMESPKKEKKEKVESLRGKYKDAVAPSEELLKDRQEEERETLKESPKVDRGKLAEDASKFISELKKAGWTEAKALDYYRTTLLGGLAGLRVSELDEKDLLELRKRLDEASAQDIVSKETTLKETVFEV